MSRPRRSSRATAVPSQDAIDARTVLPKSRFIVYAVLGVTTWLVTTLSCIGTLPEPLTDWAAWQADGASLQLGRAGFFTGMLLCVEYVIVSTIYLRVAQRRSGAAIAGEIVGEIIEMAVDGAAASGGRPSKNL